MLEVTIYFELRHGIDVEFTNYTDDSKQANKIADRFEKYCMKTICDKASFVNTHQFSTEFHQDFKFADLPDATLFLILDYGLLNDIRNHVKKYNFQVENFKYWISTDNTLKITINFSAKNK